MVRCLLDVKYPKMASEGLNHRGEREFPFPVIPKNEGL